mmetsp:Transcript_15507/g.32053  ORF Transcript_15507/g.32053 Transcript_15507/m.32053 type:complete len:251 (-) Transcript_15507:60-812(-)
MRTFVKPETCPPSCGKIFQFSQPSLISHFPRVQLNAIITYHYEYTLHIFPFVHHSDTSPTSCSKLTHVTKIFKCKGRASSDPQVDVSTQTGVVRLRVTEENGQLSAYDLPLRAHMLMRIDEIACLPKGKKSLSKRLDISQDIRRKDALSILHWHIVFHWKTGRETHPLRVLHQFLWIIEKTLNNVRIHVGKKGSYIRLRSLDTARVPFLLCCLEFSLRFSRAQRTSFFYHNEQGNRLQNCLQSLADGERR